MKKDIHIGVYCASSQTGRAYCSDLLKNGYSVYGYLRESAHGEEFLQAIRRQGGIRLERPSNRNGENPCLIPVEEGQFGHDLHKLVWESDFIILSEPSNFFLGTVKTLKKFGLAESKVPVILAPPRTFAVPYLWNVLETEHPFICFSTSPYSCKAPAPGTSYIKRRKRCWAASLEGNFERKSIDMIGQIFPQAILGHVPAVTSIGNIGAVFHPTPYILKYPEICQAQKEGRPYSYYMEAIAAAPDVAAVLEKIDQVRLQIADRLGLETFGLAGSEHEEKWAGLMTELRSKEDHLSDLRSKRMARSKILCELSHTITSAQHWLDYTYGVVRKPGEGLGEAIGRTPTYQKMSVPQKRYLEEDIPSSLLPMMMIAKRLGLNADPMEQVMNRYYALFGTEHSEFWRDLSDFSDDFIVDYLQGKYFSVN